MSGMLIIKKIRKKLGWSRYQMAQELNISLNRYLRLEGKTDKWSPALELQIEALAIEYIQGFTEKDFRKLKIEEAKRQGREEKKRLAEKKEERRKKLKAELDSLDD